MSFPFSSNSVLLNTKKVGTRGLERASGTCGTEVPKGREVGVGVGAGRMASPASHHSLYSSALYFLPLNVLSPSSIPSTRIFLLLLRELKTLDDPPPYPIADLCLFYKADVTLASADLSSPVAKSSPMERHAAFERTMHISFFCSSPAHP